MILQGIFPDTRIMLAIILESIVFILGFVITGMIYFRYRKNQKKQLLIMTRFFICYNLAILGSIVGKTLTYVNGSYDLDKTELGLFTNWSFSLSLIALSLYWQSEVAWHLFPPKSKNYRSFAQISTIALFLIVLTIPRYGINGEPLFLYPLKFILVFLYVLATSLYYMINSYKIYTFIRNRFMQHRIIAGLVFYSCIVLVFVFLMISSIYGSITGIYYTWGYFLSIASMIGAAIAGFFTVKQGKESDREDINEELHKMLQDKKNRNVGKEII
ncbi:MAG: hypothetical protein JW776_05190 [Candidatus Lokiarchaeota archaeon]|nr:hypothetical protein [Candidatus Lokiarchaeota archaeon]